MKWDEKTPKQYQAFATLVMGQENDKEIYLDADDYQALLKCLDTVKQWIDEVPGPNDDWPDTKEEWHKHLESMKWDRQGIIEVRQKLEEGYESCVENLRILSSITNFDLMRLERGKVTPEELREQKKRQIINKGIKELTDG
tara:strand:- start:12 stop:434 length:423 start_codon:yes stop_codon:yes gene_type:complete